MSGTPNKRSHEESGGGQSSASRYSRDDSATYSNKLPSNDYRDMAPDAPPRLPKIPRTESRDVDRRLTSMHYSPYRVVSPLLYEHSDHPIPSEDRLEHRDAKDSTKVEIRDTKTDSRELYQSNKVDKDVRFSSRGGEDGKETKYERDAYPDYRSEMKQDKDGGYSSVNNHLNWKESKEHHRAKKHPDSSAGIMDTWQTSRTTTHGPIDAGKESSTREEKDHAEASEAVGENKVDVKGEDKLKDKDRKRKDGKPRDWGERDKERSEPRNNLQLGNSSNEFKEPSKEEKEAEKLEKERKDVAQDKDKARDREKDHVKREAWSGAEKEGFKNEKEANDVSVRAPEQDNFSIDQKKVKDSDSWKDVDKESKDRRKERDTDVEGERSEKHSRGFDKESDDGGADIEGGVERDREVLNYGIQQRKRMLRPRGSPQVGSREPRFRSRAPDNEGSIGKSDISIVIYRVGECMQELIKLWKEHESSQPDKISESLQNGPTLEIRIPAEHVTATNRQTSMLFVTQQADEKKLNHDTIMMKRGRVRGGQLWGTDIYTNDSDLVAVLMHTGYCRPTASPPPPAIQELRATVRVLPPQDCYISTLRNNVRSRAWGAAIGCSYRVERCCIVKKGGGTIDLEPCLTHTSTVEPTLAPVVVERTMTTRAAASNALRQQRFVREVTIQYNLCNEPWIKYSISAVADKGLKKPLFTSARLKKGEVLYMESHSRRYELCFNGEKMIKAMPSSQANEMESEKYQTQGVQPSNGERSTTDSDTIVMDVFRWSRCKNPLPQKVMRTIGIPLPPEHLEVMEENLDWEDIQWSQTGVWICGKEYPLARVHFMSPN